MLNRQDDGRVLNLCVVRFDLARSLSNGLAHPTLLRRSKAGCLIGFSLIDGAAHFILICDYTGKEVVG
jgi:hypothetical protein